MILLSQFFFMSVIIIKWKKLKFELYLQMNQESYGKKQIKNE